MALIRAVERAFGDSITFAGAVVVIIMAIHFSPELNFAQIFSALEIMAALKYYMLCLVVGIGLTYELKSVFARFASIMNLQNILMVEVDPANHCIFPKKEE